MKNIRKNIALETDSALALMQEIYNDIVNLNNDDKDFINLFNNIIHNIVNYEYGR